MEKRADWLRKAAAACEKVGILNKAGLLVNVGALSESNDPRRAIFHSFSSEGMADIWYDVEEAGELGHKTVLMTPELERRWTLLHKLRNTVWSSQPNSVLEEALRLATIDRPSDTLADLLSLEARTHDLLLFVPYDKALQVATSGDRRITDLETKLKVAATTIGAVIAALDEVSPDWSEEEEADAIRRIVKQYVDRVAELEASARSQQEQYDELKEATDRWLVEHDKVANLAEAQADRIAQLETTVQSLREENSFLKGQVPPTRAAENSAEGETVETDQLVGR